MSEVEKVGVSDDTLQEPPTAYDILTAMALIMDSCVDKACHIVAATKESGNLKAMDSTTEVKEDYNDYSFLVDVFGSDMANNVAFYLDEASATNDLKMEEHPEALVVSLSTVNSPLFTYISYISSKSSCCFDRRMTVMTIN